MSEEKSEDGLSFIKEVAKYFMDFLETDFHKRKNPKRSIKLHNEDNLLLGLNLDKYPNFRNKIWSLINHGFDRDKLNKIEKGVYRTNIPANLQELIKLQIDRVPDKTIQKVVKDVSARIEEAAVLYKQDYDAAIINSLDATSLIIKQSLVLPFIESMEKSLENLDLGDENGLFLMEEDLTSVLSKLLKDEVSEVLKLLLSDVKVNIPKQLRVVFETEEVKGKIIDFFEDFKVADLFNEIYEIDRNKNILDKQDFYLYFCDITFDKVKYPIFYIPFSINKDSNHLNLDFDAQVYINKKALEYIMQEYNRSTGKAGNLKTVNERIVYLAQYQEKFKDLMDIILKEIVNSFELDKDIDIYEGNHQVSKSLLVRISNSCYISLFDKSDEALINDYEDILQLIDSGDSALGEAFGKLIEDFINNDPDSFNTAIDEEWDGTDVTEKLLSVSPIPLNSEQRQILSAINKDKCKYLIVEGPPGTGKSHTITAIVFDMILKNKSILVLSDKKEALDVVEDKITNTMNKVRLEKSFQNPILRLGKTGSTYSQILSPSSLNKIWLHYKAVKKEHEVLDQNIEKLSNTLREDIEAEILAYRDISIQELQELNGLESCIEERGFIVDTDEFMSQPDPAFELDELRSALLKIKKLSENQALTLLKIYIDNIKNLDDLSSILKLAKSFLSLSNKIKEKFGEDLGYLKIVDGFSENNLGYVGEFIKEYDDIKSPVLGYIFKKKNIERMDNEFCLNMPNIKLAQPHKNINELKKIQEFYNFVSHYGKEQVFDSRIKQDFIMLADKFIKNGDISVAMEELVSVEADIKGLINDSEIYPKTFEKVGIDIGNFETIVQNELAKLPDSEFDKLARYFYLKKKIETDFARVPFVDYSDQQKNIESLVTTQMAYLMDGRVIKFFEGNKATAKALREIIKSKQRFPKDEFMKLKEAFPCILAGIRDYAEYIPLEPELFDLVIIDEASQVSIAQAFPALLRAKKVLILGDRKQFSNVKAAQARSDTNKEYLNRLDESFKKYISQEPTKLVKLGKFDIKTSILEFFEFISNYNTQLKKHFRGYKEIISYSNKFFYQGSLQVMKIRGKSIDDVLKFSVIDHDGKIEVSSNTNASEADFIIDELHRLKNENCRYSVGIITPHTDQQKLLMEKINKLADRDYYFDELGLKIMTFDTCQGEERDIVYYSMVATEERDRLWGVFASDLSKIDVEEEDKIKAQRLNVGFSRAKECMHFVLSKPIDKFKGSIGDAIRHYYNTLEQAKNEKNIDEVDKNSKMEERVLHWYYQTQFYLKNSEDVEFFPQFELGKYLHQMDPTYNHPNYKVDFLLVYNKLGKEHKIIIEYDGFKEHFTDLEAVNKYNFNDYYSEEDVYRQKVLESYGYKFLRINRFNVGENPIETLDERIELLIKEYEDNKYLDSIYGNIQSLQSGEMKECPKCKEIRNLNDFKDNSLITGYGRFCCYCKSGKTKNIEKGEETALTIEENILCPRCGSAMVLRSGKYGKFYGCSRFPYCRGTKK